MTVRLYGIPASNAVLTAQLALQRKGIPFRRIDQLPVVHRMTMRLRGFDGSTVPGIAVDGCLVHGTRAILPFLDGLKPEPRLYPEDPQRRAAVEEAVAWAEHVYQRTLRYLLPWSLLQRPEAVASILEDALMAIPTSLAITLSRPAIYANSLINSSNEASVRRKLEALPGMFDRVDHLIANGVLNAAEPGAADVMIAPSTRAFLWWDELRPLLEGRPAGEHARLVAHRFPGAIPHVFPPDALPAR